MSSVDSFFWVWLNENLYKSRSQPLEFFRGQDSGWDRLKPSLESFSKFLDRSTLEKLGKKWEGLDRLAYKEMVSLSLRGGVRLVTFQDEGYPPLLREIPDPPLALFVKDALRVFSRCVAVAGTRNPSAYGHRMARECGKALAEKGYIVVSGLARGIDTEAHLGALEGGGKTVAVLAGDVEKVYPPENKRIAEDIVRNGAIVSETPPNVSIDKLRFLRRNRITSGMSICLVVVESPGRGGTSTQVDHALAQGRRVFVMVPEKGHSDLREGFEEYLSRGAEPFGDIPEMISCIEEVSTKVDRRETKGQRQLDVFSR